MGTDIKAIWYAKAIDMVSLCVCGVVIMAFTNWKKQAIKIRNALK